MTLDATPDPIARLAEYRLEHGLTFAALADEMKRANFPVLPRALHLALTNRLRTRPRATTLYRITGFVATLPKAPARKRRTAAA